MKLELRMLKLSTTREKPTNNYRYMCNIYWTALTFLLLSFIILSIIPLFLYSCNVFLLVLSFLYLVAQLNDLCACPWVLLGIVILEYVAVLLKVVISEFISLFDHDIWESDKLFLPFITYTAFQFWDPSDGENRIFIRMPHKNHMPETLIYVFTELTQDKFWWWCKFGSFGLTQHVTQSNA